MKLADVLNPVSYLTPRDDVQFAAWHFLGFADELATPRLKHCAYSTDDEGHAPMLRGTVMRAADQDGCALYLAGYSAGSYGNRGAWSACLPYDPARIRPVVDTLTTFADIQEAAMAADQMADLKATELRDARIARENAAYARRLQRFRRRALALTN